MDVEMFGYTSKYKMTGICALYVLVYDILSILLQNED